jgi:transposase-like protein
MAKRVYTDDDKARVLALLLANSGNVKRTARDTGVAEQTIRDWKKLEERGGTSVAVAAALPSALNDFAQSAESIRDKMLNNLEAKVMNDELNARDLIVGIGVLTEKIAMARGEATSRTENTVKHEVDPEQLSKAVQDVLSSAISSGEQRDVEIIDADYEEQADTPELLAAP